MWHYPSSSLGPSTPTYMEVKLGSSTAVSYLSLGRRSPNAIDEEHEILLLTS